MARFGIVGTALVTLAPWMTWFEHAEHVARPYANAVSAWTKHTLHWASAHTGLPVAVVAALGIVLAWRVVRRTWLVVFELTVAFGLLFAATRLGWLRW